MKNKYFIIPKKKEEKMENVEFLYPLQGFCVGFLKEFSIEEITEEDYIYVNRILDTEGILALKKILDSNKIKGIVFEDLGIVELLKDKKIKKIFYATHATCSKFTAQTYLKYVDYVILSLDITQEEIKEIIEYLPNSIGLFTYGLMPLMYSRRTLIKNYEVHYNLEETNDLWIEEPNTKEQFYLIQNEYGTVIYDSKKYDGRELLNLEGVAFHLLNLQWDNYEKIQDFLKSFETEKSLENWDGFLHQKTIYRLPPKG